MEQPRCVYRFAKLPVFGNHGPPRTLCPERPWLIDGPTMASASGSSSRRCWSTSRGARRPGWQVVTITRLRCDQGRRAEARDLLAPIYGWFTETADLKKAKALLQQLVVSAEIANDPSRFAHCEILLAVASKVLQRLPMASFQGCKLQGNSLTRIVCGSQSRAWAIPRCAPPSCRDMTPPMRPSVYEPKHKRGE
jgi:hypothetical protein